MLRRAFLKSLTALAWLAITKLDNSKHEIGWDCNNPHDWTKGVVVCIGDKKLLFDSLGRLDQIECVSTKASLLQIERDGDDILLRFRPESQG